jgi:dihydrolipoamide dehydrogenase
VADNNFDVIIVGSGPGGYVTAIRAAQLGMKTAIIERDRLGGICLNWGCIPTKALLRSSEVHHLFEHAGDYGFAVKDVSFDVKRVVARSRAVADQMNKGVIYLMKKNKVTVIEGAGALDGTAGALRKVKVTKDGKPVADLTAKHVILATGARARTMPGLEPDGKLVWTYKEAMVPETMPKSLLVVGSGAIGIEFASFYHDMGADVTVVEVLDRVLPVEDEDISAFAHSRSRA